MNITKKNTKNLIWRVNLLILLCFFAPADNRLLWLIGANHPLGPFWCPQQLIVVSGYPIHPEAGEAFNRMKEDMNAAGIKNLRLQSAYRPYNYQRALFEDKVKTLHGLGYSKEEAHVQAAKSVAVPGTSEHQTGLAADVSIDGKLDAHFGTTEAGVWLQNNSDKYGFIIRYPKEKTDVTTIIYEPWHLRYVGIPHASYMKEHDMCLEEYIAYVKKAGIVLYWLDERNYYKISYTCGAPQGREAVYSSIGPWEDAGYIVTERKVFMR